MRTCVAAPVIQFIRERQLPLLKQTGPKEVSFRPRKFGSYCFVQATVNRMSYENEQSQEEQQRLDVAFGVRL